MDEIAGKSLHWRTATCADIHCLEVARSGDRVLLRTTTDPDVTVRLTAQEWATFVDGVKRGELDSL